MDVIVPPHPGPFLGGNGAHSPPGGPQKESARHLYVCRGPLSSTHAAALNYWEQQKVVAAAKKPKKKPNPKPDADLQAEAAPKPAKPDPKREAKQAPQLPPKAACEAFPMEVDALAQPPAQPQAQPLAQTHSLALDGGETQAMTPLWEDPTGPNPEV